MTLGAALWGSGTELALTVLKAAVLFVVAVVALRLSERRLLAELDVYDVVVTVAVGAIIGRTATSSTAAALTGVAALLTLLVLHRAFSWLRRSERFSRSFARKPIVLVAHGDVRGGALRRAGLTRRDLDRLLRQAGATDPAALDYVLYEQQGALTVVPRGQAVGSVLRAGLRDAGLPAHPSDGSGRSDPPRPDPTETTPPETAPTKTDPTDEEANT